MDSEKLKLITEDSETMLNTLKDFNKYNKKYNIICYNQLLINADFYKKYNFKDRFKDILPFVISLKYIIDYCNKYIENAGFLSFDEIENIIKEHQGKKQKTNKNKGKHQRMQSEANKQKKRSDVPEDFEPFELGEEEEEEKEKPTKIITKRNIIKQIDIKEFKEIEDDKILIYLPELVELLKKEGFKTTEKDEEEFIKQNIKGETKITPNRIMTIESSTKGCSKRSENEKNNEIIFNLYITRKYFENNGYNVIAK